jgi:hypothetical protein
MGIIDLRSKNTASRTCRYYLTDDCPSSSRPSLSEVRREATLRSMVSHAAQRNPSRQAVLMMILRQESCEHVSDNVPAAGLPLFGARREASLPGIARNAARRTRGRQRLQCCSKSFVSVASVGHCSRADVGLRWCERPERVEGSSHCTCGTSMS